MVSVVGSTAVSAEVPKKEEQPINSQQFNKVTDVILQGKKIGTRNTTVQYDRTVSSGEVTVILHTDTKYSFEPAVSQEVKDLYQDTSKDDIIKETTDKKYFLNGKQVTNADAPLIRNSAPAMPLASQDTGGIPKVCHYYGDYQTYTYACYQGMQTDGSPTGSNITKTNIPFSKSVVKKSLLLQNEAVKVTKKNGTLSM
ncbi:hypothetical protein N0M98_30760 [Paenibacillus doosanensis]|nr:hypothetical protein [Paenibacillus doosanensis]